MTEEENNRAVPMRADVYRARLVVARTDTAQHMYTVKSVTEKTAASCVCRFTDGTCLIVEARLCDERGAPRILLPQPGDKLVLFGKGLGYEVRGIGQLAGRKVTGLYRYETEGEMKARYEIERAEKKEKDRRDWDAAKDETAARVAKLPEAFQKRFEFFMRDPNWGPEFGKYELFVMEEAVKIATELRTVEAIQAFAQNDWATQKRNLPTLDKTHSGNTFSAAMTLAVAYRRRLEDPSAPKLFKFHGALCPLVGCENYGCYSTTVDKKTS